MRINPLHKNDDDVLSNDETPPATDVLAGRAGASGEPEVRGDAGTEPVGRHSPERGVAEPAAVDDTSRRARDMDVATEKRRIAPKAPQFGSGLCGYLAAVGGYVVIAAIVHAVVAKVDTGHHIANALDVARLNQPTSVSWTGAIALLVLAFLVCLIGGYVCGTMARRSGVLEGFAVWLWAAVAAVVASLIVELANSRYAVLYQFDLFPRVEVGGLAGRNGAIVCAIILAAGGLIGALIGGAIGAAAHRHVRVLDAASWSR